MKPKFLLVLAIIAANFSSACPAQTNSLRVGIYDSRAVAYAWFWTASHQKELNEMIQSARSAQKSGDTNRFNQLAAKLSSHQNQMHREVFSTAPPTEALAELKDRLPQIEKSAGVTDIVSQWDESALKKFAGAERVDVTDTLVREFITPTAQQHEVISSMKNVKPLSLDECNELIRKGKI